jgi:hypothetical protein
MRVSILSTYETLIKGVIRRNEAYVELLFFQYFD